MSLQFDEISAAVKQFAMLRHFPAGDPDARAALMELLARMVNTAEELTWLVRVMLDEVGEWQGPKELRGVFCAKFRPKDGVEAWCSSGPFSAGALEGQSEIEAAQYRALPLPNMRQVLDAEFADE